MNTHLYLVLIVTNYRKKAILRNSTKRADCARLLQQYTVVAAFVTHIHAMQTTWYT